MSREGGAGDTGDRDSKKGVEKEKEWDVRQPLLKIIIFVLFFRSWWCSLTVLLPEYHLKEVTARLGQIFISTVELSNGSEDIKNMEDTSQCSEDGLDKQEEADGLAEDSDPPPAKLKWKKCAEKRVKKSPVWKYFKKCPDVADVCLCLTCGARVKSNRGTTTNMMNHLRRHHDWEPDKDSGKEGEAAVQVPPPPPTKAVPVSGFRMGGGGLNLISPSPLYKLPVPGTL